MIGELTIKHAGKKYEIGLDDEASGADFKNAVHHATGVPPDRMKVMIKGGLLKDNVKIAAVNLLSAQPVMVIGTSGPLPVAPQEPTLFLEDVGNGGTRMDDSPPGLVNLGQTCYFNSSLQMLKTIPQLSSALERLPISRDSPEARFSLALKGILTTMSRSSAPVHPFTVLNHLRVLAPQFAEHDSNGGYSQQDADEAWTQMISALRSTLAVGADTSFIDQAMSIELSRSLQCNDSLEEPPSRTQERVLKLQCNISIATNFLSQGMLDNLNQQIEKTSPFLGRMATYTQRSRISRLPQNLVIHMVRFYWRRDIQKKAKIMRKVKFPLQLEVLDMVTDDLRQRLQPANSLVKQILHSREDRYKTAKRLGPRTATQLADEENKRREEKALFDRTIEDVDGMGKPSGLYELTALITHKGASADSGHYIGWARKDSEPFVPSNEQQWYKYDDDKVSLVNAEKILSMEGGGEDSVAYILLYR
uniref:Ubiquitin carboxyl-terminal hydrolase n=1 Tax=Kwoniella heveanensis TaxID=89924 RepID=D1MBK8_9TREE|nr:CNG04540-like protein [Kwoniella heveanensis]